MYDELSVVSDYGKLSAVGTSTLIQKVGLNTTNTTILAQTTIIEFVLSFIDVTKGFLEHLL